MKILFATDASEAAAEAAKFLATLPLAPGTAIHVVTVGDRLSEWMIDWPHAAVEFTAAFPLPEETEILVTQVLRPFHAKHLEQAMEPEEAERLEQHVRHDRREAAEQFVGSIVASLQKRVAHVTPVVREGDPA